jgi:ABC-2 type transport system ATP-binding protein
VHVAVEVTDLGKRYGGRAVVDGLSLRAEAGAVTAILGPNGAGKTTTVECVSGFRRPDAGRVRVLGHDPITERAAVVSRLGVMLQEGGAYQAATPREMLRLQARFYADPLDPDALLERVGLAGSAATTRYRVLSGGQKQRLNLALALVGRPRVAVLDEPTAGMDPQARLACWDLIQELRDDGVAVLLTTHFMDEAERLADVVAVIDGGRLVAMDSPAGLLGGGDADRVLVTTPADVAAEALATAVGAPVDRQGSGRFIVHAGAEAIPVIAAWFAREGLPLTGVSAGAAGLEEVVLRLTDAGRAGGAA